MTVVRAANAEDMVLAAAVSERAFRQVRTVYQPTDAAVARKFDQAGTWKRLIAERNRQIVATVEYRMATDRLSIRDLAVDPDFQHQGIARQIVDALAGIARADGLRALSIFTIRETGNVRVFEHLGFTVVSQEVATWCVSDAFATLHETYMERHSA
jgi:N-acetylglutamate synthase-like GNAT family acetyltransferase